MRQVSVKIIFEELESKENGCVIGQVFSEGRDLCGLWKPVVRVKRALGVR